MTEENPYETPLADPTGKGAPERVIGSPRKIVWAWEKLRLRYNLILAVPGIAILFFYMYRAELPFAGAISGGTMMAVGANLCFLIGLISEMYAAALFDKTEMPAYRKIAFWLGIVGSLALFAFAIIPLFFFRQLV
ncbi:MAG: hypothetical protein AB8F34_06550 [Akkermansiaceae bacterium]